eukprot:6813460-Prymnesium_polylepis.1
MKLFGNPRAIPTTSDVPGLYEGLPEVNYVPVGGSASHASRRPSIRGGMRLCEMRASQEQSHPHAQRPPLAVREPALAAQPEALAVRLDAVKAARVD